MDQLANEDIVQKALTIIYENYKTAELHKGIMPWAYRILENVMRNEYQTVRRRQNLLKKDSDKLNKIYGSWETRNDSYEYKELIHEIRSALNQLSNKEKEIFELKLKGYSGVEIQEKLGLKRNIMDIRVFRGSKKLKKILLKRGLI
ncbi:sigma-70 family RNA polymerase sigma factor [bacterium]|nr:sigma-70 family RNA polymerase sigma factor [bacterium]